MNTRDLKHWLERNQYRYCCFISWPTAGGRKAELLVKRLKEAIIEEAPQRGLPAEVFTSDSIPHGADWEPKMAEALCRSIAMVAICGPEYYDSQWCGREWAGMLDLAESRLGAEDPRILPLLMQPLRSAQTSGLVQVEQLPPPVERLHCGKDLSRLRLRSDRYHKTNEFDDIVSGIVDRIQEIARLLAERERAADCAGFHLPKESAFAGPLQQPEIFPFRPEHSTQSPRSAAAAKGQQPALAPTGRIPGDSKPKVVTFYSFKGGVGRSMAVANVGRIIARDSLQQGQECLLIDWDLEAPGLERYFRVAQKPDRGLIEYFHALAGVLRNRSGFYEALAAENRAQVLDREIALIDYTVETGVPHLRLMAAGAGDSIGSGEYQRQVMALAWVDLFQRYPLALRAFRELLETKFQYTLIDSRTGISDTAGICTAILPDRLVAMFGPSPQNDAILRVIEAALEHRRLSDDDRPLQVFPIASRFDAADLGGLWRSLKSFAGAFSTLFQRAYGLKTCDLREYFEETLLLYVPRYLYTETAIVDQGEPRFAGSLRRGYESVTARLLSPAPPWAEAEKAMRPASR